LQTNLQPTDTPPVTPTSPVTHTGTDLVKRNTRIHINEQGIHDFDFKNRQDGPKKLRKSNRRSDQLSISSMTDVPQRTPSDGSDGSIRKRFSSIFIGSGQGDKLHKTDSGRSTNSVDIPEDPLPDTKKELEVRLNYHLAELDMLKKTIGAANDVIRQHFERYQILQGRSNAGMRYAMMKQEQMVEQARTNRDSYVSFVSYHRRQLEMIKRKRIDIEVSAGLEPTLPEVYKSMWGDDEWGQLFKV